MAQDYYKTLGVDRKATPQEIKSAYRKKAMQYHPDKNPGDKKAEEHFKEISQAYEILSDPQKKAAYDQYGHAAFQGGQGGHPGGGFGGFGGFEGGFDFRSSGFGNFSDIFENVFSDFAGSGGHQRQSGSSQLRGDDLRYDLEISLNDAFQGIKKSITIRKLNACGTCAGSGAKKGSSPVTCATCHGSGKIRAQQGFFVVERACTSCQGLGKIIKDPCPTCHGQGAVKSSKTLEVSIPAGIEEGVQIRLTGEGNAGLRGGPAGDLYVFVHIKSHDLFKRVGNDLLCQAPVSMVKATLGGELELPTIDGSRVTLTIPAGTQPGDRFRLKGKGMSIYKRPTRGDMYVEVQVEIPKNLTKSQKEVLESFEKTSSSNKHQPDSFNFFKKVKKMMGDDEE